MAMTVPIHAAKTRLTQLIPRVEAGERITITRRGKPVADLVAHQAAEGEPEGFFERLARIRQEQGWSRIFTKIPDDFDDPLPDSFWFPDDHPPAA